MIRFRQTIDRMIAGDSQELERIRRAAVRNFDTARALRGITLLARIDALTDVVGRLVRRDQAIRKDGTAFVVVAGPNAPEVLTVVELAEVYTEFEPDEVGVWRRTSTGDLESLAPVATRGPVDDQFEYWTIELWSTKASETVATVSTSRKRTS